MCMKNINTDIVFFEQAELSSDEKQMNLFSVNKDFPKLKVKKNITENVLTISQINLLLSVNATEKMEAGKPYHEEGETPENTFFFKSNYKIRLRVTEPESGKFVDLETISLAQHRDCQEIVHRKIYNEKFACKYSNVSVAIPPDDKEGTCVLKVLVRKVPDEGEQENKWFVQSVHPIILDIQECEC